MFIVSDLLRAEPDPDPDPAVEADETVADSEDEVSGVPRAVRAIHSLEGNGPVVVVAEDETTVTVAVGADVYLVTVMGPLCHSDEPVVGKTVTVAGSEKSQ
ncbi:hypothetical protein N0V90_000212 [Kalmusia sp. IMI 367209]|nr:hypothetical protein N0V90_000212 [Kalmusia sp. IMI 367209]